MTRTDQHAPKNFVPADYEVVDYLDAKSPRAQAGEIFMAGIASGAPSAAVVEMIAQAQAAWEQHVFTYFPGYRTGGDDHTSMHNCNHCGHPGIRWVAVVQHKPSGKYLSFGEICATERVGLEYDAYRFRALRTHAEKMKAKLEKDAKRDAFIAEHEDVIDYLISYEDKYASGGRFNNFLQSLLDQYRRKGELSERQVAAVRRNIERDAQWAAKWAAEVADAGPLPTGKNVAVAGTMVSLKWKTGYGGDPVLKMLVKLEDGNKIWGTVPNALSAARPIGVAAEVWLKDKAITFVAGEIKGSDDDEHFGFFKSPRNARFA